MLKKMISLVLAIALLCTAAGALAEVNAEEAFKSFSDDDLFILQYYLLKELRSRGLTDEDNALLEYLEEAVEDGIDENLLVWVSRYGTKYHTDKTCGTTVCTRQITLKEAAENDYVPCQRCNPPALDD